MPVKSAKESSAAKGTAAKVSDKAVDKAVDKGAAKVSDKAVDKAVNKGAAAKVSDKAVDKAAEKGAAAKSPPAKGGAKESVLNEVAKATGVSKAQIAKVLDHLGLGQKLSGLDAKLAKDASKVSAADLKLAIKLDDGSIVI